MITALLGVLAVLVLTLGTALFVAAEFSLVAVERTQLEAAAKDGDDPGARRVLAAVRSLSFQLSGAQLGITVTTLVVLAAFTWLVSATSLGRSMRACEQDRKMAGLLGIDTDRTISLTFVLGAMLAAVAGLMFLLYYGVIDFFIGFVAGVKAFTAAVLGGIGSLPGAVLGGLAIGLIETFWSAYASAQYKDVAAFSILIVVLIFLPTGLLGRQDVEKV